MTETEFAASEPEMATEPPLAESPPVRRWLALAWFTMFLITSLPG